MPPSRLSTPLPAVPPAAAGSASALARAAPRCSGRSIVYLVVLNSTTRSAPATDSSPVACPSRSRYCPANTSVRIRSSTGRPRRSASSGRPLAWNISSVQQMSQEDGHAHAEHPGGAVPTAGGVARLELPVHGGLAPPGIAGVHEVVVDQRTGVQQLQGRGGIDDLRAVRPAGPAPPPVAERGAQPLAAGQQPRDRLRARPQRLPGGQEHAALLAGKGLQRAVHPATDVSQRRGARCHGGEIRSSRTHRARAGPAGNVGAMPFGPEHQAPAIRDLLAGSGRSFSFEFMPPKTEMGEGQLWRAIRRLEPLRPAFVSVTYGAGGSTRERTVRVTGRIAAETTLTPAGHITAV